MLESYFIFQSYNRILSCLLVAFTPVIVEAQIEIVEDINTTIYFNANSSIPSHLVNLNGEIIFSAQTGLGRELWKTNGDSATTELIKDILPGVRSSSPRNLIVINDKVLFTALTGAHGRELWVTDGSEDGTYMLKDTSPGQGGIHELQFVKVNNEIYFISGLAYNGYKLWKSDGTKEGTVVVKDIATFPIAATEFQLKAVDNMVFIKSQIDDNFIDLWKSDGTANGTTKVGQFENDSRRPLGMAALNGQLYFSTDCHNRYNVNCGKLWVTDGTSVGTSVFRSFAEQIKTVYLSNLLIVGSKVFFLVNKDGKSELWSSDGTEQGTLRVKSGFDAAHSVNGREFELLNFDDRLILDISDNVHGDALWISDGTESGTQLIRDFSPGSASSVISDFHIFDNEVYFNVSNQVWKSDGTDLGTVLISSDLQPLGSYTSRTVGQESEIYFNASSASSNHEIELYKLSKSNPTPVLVADLLNGTNSSNPSNLVLFKDKLCFSANPDYDSNSSLYCVDSLKQVVSQVKNFHLSGNGLGIQDIIAGKDYLYIYAGGGLWKSDGTSAGTTVIVESIGINLTGSGPEHLISINNNVFFVLHGANTGSELWVSDGTQEGTRLVKDINPGSASSLPSNFVSYDGLMVFQTLVENRGSELWITDGSESGTQLLKGISESVGSSDLDSFVEFKNILFFSVKDDGAVQLWRTDGTSEGTFLIENKWSGSNPLSDMTVTDDYLYFLGFASNIGYSIWKTDGTSEGTTIVSSGPQGQFNWNPDNLTHIGDELFFTASTSVHGNELWTSDGTQSGTKLLKDINPGSSSFPFSLVVHQDRLFFKANDPTGWSIWESDGTEEGTVFLESFTENFTYHNYLSFLPFQGAIYFRADDISYGSELRRYKIKEKLPTYSFNDQTFTVFENAELGTIIGTIVLPDGFEAESFEIVGGIEATNIFHINGNAELLVLDGSLLNYEEIPLFEMKVIFSSLGIEYSLNITIELLDVNDEPTLDTVKFEIVENIDNGTIIGELVTSDEDGDEVLVIILDTEAIAVSDTGELTVVDSVLFDFESDSIISIPISITDLEDTVSYVISIDILDVNEAPTVQGELHFEIEENLEAEVIIGQIEALDEDGDAISFTIENGNINDAFILSDDGILSVNNSEALDFEVTPSFQLEIDVNDGQLSSQSLVNITLIDLDENITTSVSSDVSFKYYPNPVERELFIENLVGVEEIRITDLSGRIRKAYKNTNKQNIMIGLDDLDKGIYILEIDGKSAKLIKL